MSEKTKQELRQALRTARREAVTALPESMRALVFHRPPTPLLELVPLGTVIGLYHANPHEAPPASYAKFFFERGHTLALPRFENRNSAMQFAHFGDPFEESDLETGPFGLMQPAGDAEICTPDILFVPLVGFTESGQRLGQGGGHYDRWLEANPETFAIGLGWDGQLVDAIPAEPHDRNLHAVVTPTRLYGPFA